MRISDASFPHKAFIKFLSLGGAKTLKWRNKRNYEFMKIHKYPPTLRSDLLRGSSPVEVKVLGGSGVVAAFVLEFGEVVEDVEILGLELVVLLERLEELTTVARVLNLLRHVRVLENLQRVEKRRKWLNLKKKKDIYKYPMSHTNSIHHQTTDSIQQRTPH